MPTQAIPTYTGNQNQPNPANQNANYYTQNGVRYDLNNPNATALSQDARGPMGIEGAALADPNSTASNNMYYGGSAGAANQQMEDRRTAGVHAYDRAAPQWDSSQYNQSRGMAAGLGGQLQGLAAGDPNSLAQQQLHRGYAASNAALTGQAAGTRGGPLATSLARRTAGNQQSLNGQQESVASKELMAQQQMAAYGQLASLGAGMRGTDQSVAFGQTDAEMRNRAANDAEQARQESMRSTIGQLGMTGAQNRQTAQSNWNGLMTGEDLKSTAINQQNGQQMTSTILGATQGGLAAAAKLGESTSDTTPTPKKKDPFAWSS